MSQFFLENAHNRIDQEKYAEGWERVFGKKKACKCEDYVSNFGGIDVTCGECGRVMAKAIKEEKED